jgi:hypothetical protein
MDWRVSMTTFGVIFLAEMGDKTQLAAMTMAATFSALFPKGISADNVREKKLGFFPRLFVRSAIALSRGSRDWFGIHPQPEAQQVVEARRAA